MHVMGGRLETLVSLGTGVPSVFQNCFLDLRYAGCPESVLPAVDRTIEECHLVESDNTTQINNIKVRPVTKASMKCSRINMYHFEQLPFC